MSWPLIMMKGEAGGRSREGGREEGECVGDGQNGGWTLLPRLHCCLLTMLSRVLKKEVGNLVPRFCCLDSIENTPQLRIG
jgi:hypothetical protein